MLSEVTKTTFDANYPENDFENINVSIEYPDARKDYPGIWIDYSPVGDMQSAGINHVEMGPLLEDGTRLRTTVWRYAGIMQFTCVAMTSLERDRLVDEMTKVLAFGLLNPERAVFRQGLLANTLIAVDPQWDKVGLTGKDETPGTPWGTDEIIYEQTVTMGCTGYFYVDLEAVVLVPLSAIRVYDWIEGQTPPVETAGPGWQ